MATKINNANVNTENMVRYIGITLEEEGKEPKDYVITSARGKSRKTGFPQLEGHIYAPNSKSSTGYVQVNRWIWGWDAEENHLIHDNETGEFRAWVSSEWFDGMGIAIAGIVYNALHNGEGLIDCPFKKPEPAIKKQAVIKTANVFEAAPAPCDTDAPLDIEEDEDVQDDLAMLDGMGESPLTRLNTGDPSFFVELGASQGHARQWAKWIRENGTHFNDISDIIKVQGIGNKTANALTAAYNEKYSA